MKTPTKNKKHITWISQSTTNSTIQYIKLKLQIIKYIITLMTNTYNKNPSKISFSNKPNISQIGPNTKQIKPNTKKTQPPTPPQTINKTTYTPNNINLFPSYCPYKKNTNYDSKYYISSPNKIIYTKPYITNYPNN